MKKKKRCTIGVITMWGMMRLVSVVIGRINALIPVLNGYAISVVMIPCGVKMCQVAQQNTTNIHK